MPKRRQKRRAIVDDLFGEEHDSVRLILLGFRSLELLIEEALADAFGGELPDEIRRTHFNVRVSLAVALKLLAPEMKDPLGRLKSLRDEFAHANRSDLVYLTNGDGKSLYAGIKALSPGDIDVAIPGFDQDAPEVILVAFLAILETAMTAYIDTAKLERMRQQEELDEWWHERRIRSLRRLFGDDVDPQVVAQVLAALPERERALFTLRFFESTTLAGIAEEFGITRERVRQTEKQVIAKIRALLAASN
jgi:RNA polymerase sigma factor (sigma-70 family)